MSARTDIVRAIMERSDAVHIAIEEEPQYFIDAVKQPHRIARIRYRLASRLHGCSTELSLLEGHYLNVHTVRSASAAQKYQFDLRYANPRPVRVRHIAWMWLALFIATLPVAAGAFNVAEAFSAVPVLGAQPYIGVLVAAVAACASLVALFFFLRRTTESLEFRSEHGMVALLSVTGGLGGVRKGKQFFVELIKSINAAKIERPQAQQPFLRDAMREHHRLFELGVLSERDYEQSKARILAQHSGR